jgi:hypothetical protein
MKKLE